MATDIQQLLQKVQEVINAGVSTVKETRVTQDVLQRNIEVTDRKIGVHNVDEEAHPDIRERLNDIPMMLGDPIVTGPDAVENNIEYTWTVYVDLNSESYSMKEYVVMYSDGAEETIPAGGNGRGTIKHTFLGNDGDSASFSVKGRATNNYTSPTITKNLTITQHEPPNADSIVWDFPDYVNPGETQNWSISGITDDDTIADISITTNSDVEFSQSTGLTQGNTYTFTADESLRGQSGTIIFTITAKDSYGYTATKTLTLTLNRPPVIDAINLDMDDYLNAGTSSSIRVSGVTDPDGDTVTYDLASNVPGVTFGKSTGIALNETVAVNISSDLSAGTPYQITFTFHDTKGGSTVHTVSSTINTNPDITSLACSLPSFIIPGEEYQFTLTGGSDPEGDALTYAISLSDSNIGSLSSNSTTDGTSVTLTTDKTYCSSHRGNTFTLNVVATDAHGGSSTKNFTYTINNAPVISHITLPRSEYFAPDTAYELAFAGATDANNSQTLTYTLTSSNDDITVVKDTGSTFTVTTPAASVVARGTDFDLTLQVSDGYETVSKVFKCHINTLPDIGSATVDIVDHLTPGTIVNTSIEGITNADSDDTITITLESNNPAITFNKDTVAPGESFSIITSGSATAGGDYTLTFTITDESGETQTITIEGTINRAPVVSNLVCNLPEYLIPGETYEVTFSGATDPDKETMKLSLGSISSGLSFESTTNITQGNAVSLTVSSKATRGSTLSFTVTVTDASGASTSKPFSYQVNRLPVVTGVANPLSIGTILKPSTSYSGTVEGATDADGQDLTYSVSTNNDNVTASLSGSKLTLRTPAVGTLARGSSFILTISVNDGYETVTKQFTYTINRVPSGTITCTAASTMKGGTANKITGRISGATDADSQTVTYVISSISDGLTVTPTTVVQNGTITITADKVEKSTKLSFRITARDSMNESGSALTKTITVEPILITSKPRITAPTNGQVIEPWPTDEVQVTAKISAYATYADMS